MVLAIFLGFLQVISLTDSSNSDLLSESKEQAKQYINQIENGVNTEENIWALTVLGTGKEEIETFIEERSRSNKTLSVFSQFEQDYHAQLKKVVFRTGSSNLLVSLLLETEKKAEKQLILNKFISEFTLSTSQEVNYRKLCEAIINDREITEQILSNNQFLLPHFFILFKDSYIDLFSDNYLQKIIENWPSKYSSSKDLNSTFSEASYFRTLYLQDNYSGTSALYHSLINNKLFPNSSIKLQFYRYLDYSMYRLGYFDRNLDIARTLTLPLSIYLNKRSLEFQIKFTLGINSYSIGKIHQAEKVYQKVLNEIDQENPQLKLSSLYNNLALTYHRLGKYQKYLDLQFQALEKARESNNYSHQLDIYNNLFVYYRKSDNPEKALSYLQEAQQIAVTKGDSENLGTIYTSFGSFYRTFHQNYTLAQEYFSKAEETLDKQNNLRYYLKLINEQAENFESQQKYNLALKKHDEILDLASEKNGINHIDALVNKALVNLKMGNIQKAGQLISRYKSRDLNQLAFDQIIKAKTVEADYLYQTGDSQTALTILNPALEQVVVRAKSSADLKSGFWHVEDEYLDAFELAVSIYQNQGDFGQAVQKLDQLKTINDARLYQNPLVKSSLLDESELTQYKQLTAQLDATRKKLLTTEEDQQFEIQQTISKLNLKKRSLDQKLSPGSDTDDISIKEVQRRLTSSEMVMHVTELKDQYYIANITRSNVQVNTVPLDSTLRKLLSNSVQQVATHNTDLDTLFSISKLLNIDQIPSYIEKITVIPDSYLYQFPIDILPLTKPDHSYSYGATTYLIEEYETQYLTSLNDLTREGKRSSNSNNSISYAGYGVSDFSKHQNKSLVPLPFAVAEVTSIAKKLTRLSNVQTYTNNSSTKTTFTKTAPNARILHLATHSAVSEQDPMFSTVYMSKNQTSPDSTYEDQIFAYELFELNLNNEMIMLNSCESGSGSYIQGTGVMGMSRALRYAGANSLVLNLWSVNDMLASDFAIHFYDQLNEGKSKAEALQETKQYFLRTKNASPHFWGPYMLIGNSDPIVEPHYNKNMAMAGAFIFYFLLMVGLSYLKDQGILFKNSPQKAA